MTSKSHSFERLKPRIIAGFIAAFTLLFTLPAFAADSFSIGSSGASFSGGNDSFSVGSNGASYNGSNGRFSVGSGGASVNVGGVKVNIGGGGGLGGSLGSGPIFDGPGLSGGAQIVEGGLDSNVSKEADIKALIIAWTNFLLPLAAVIAVLAIVWAGFLYITSFGDDGRIETAKKIIIWVVVGIIVIAAAYAIVSFFMEAVFK